MLEEQHNAGEAEVAGAVTGQSLHFAGDMSSKDGQITPNIALHLLIILQQVNVTIQNHLRAKKQKR